MSTMLTHHVDPQAMTSFNLVCNLNAAIRDDLRNQLERGKYVFKFVCCFICSCQSLAFTPKALYLSGSWFIIPYLGFLFGNSILATILYETRYYAWLALPVVPETFTVFEGLMIESKRRHINEHNAGLLQKMDKITSISFVFGLGICLISLFTALTCY